MRGRVWGALLLSLALGLVSLWLVLPSAFTLGTLTVRIRWAYLLATLAGVALWWWLNGWRVALLVRTMGSKLSLWQGVQTHIIGIFSAAVTPSGGGSAVGTTWLLTRFAVPIEHAVVVSVLLAVLDMTFFAWAVPVSFLYLLYGEIRLPVAGLGPFIIPFSVAALGLSYLLAFRLRYATGLLKGLLHLPLLRRSTARLGTFLDELELASRAFAATPWPLHLGFHALSALSRLLFFGLLNLALAAVGLDLVQLALLALQAVVHAFAFLVPTPGASGYQEVAFSWLLKGRGRAELLSVGIVLWRTITFYLYFLLGPLIGGLTLFGPRPQTSREDALG